MNTVRERLMELLGLEMVVILGVIPLILLFFYKIFLRNMILDRHSTLRKIFREIFTSYSLFIMFWSIQNLLKEESDFSRYYPFFGMAAVVFGALVFVRSVKLMVFEYLFFKSKKVGVPVLLVNLATLLFSIFVAAWLSTSVFGVRWAPLLATSAIVSVVLGLALQDTLGNLFAGVALQFDKPFEIGDWIEVHSNQTIFAGEVHEITWRATILNGFYDEVITVPNRAVAHSEISNFSARHKPIYRAASVFLDVNASEETIKAIFEDVLKKAKGVLQGPEHFVMLRDLSEKGAHWRLFYPVGSYSRQFIILDGILMLAQGEFKKRGIEVARLRGDLNTHETSPKAAPA